MEVLRTATNPKYCAVGLYVVGNTDPTPLMTAGKVVLFDTRVIAQQFIPLLGEGRFTSWSKDGETLYFHPLKTEGYNRVCIITGWGPYNLPAGMPDHIRSETAGREWRSHIMWSHAFFDCGQWDTNSDGILVNTALGDYEPVPTAAV